MEWSWKPLVRRAACVHYGCPSPWPGWAGRAVGVFRLASGCMHMPPYLGTRHGRIAASSIHLVIAVRSASAVGADTLNRKLVWPNSRFTLGTVGSRLQAPAKKDGRDESASVDGSSGTSCPPCPFPGLPSPWQPMRLPDCSIARLGSPISNRGNRMVCTRSTDTETVFVGRDRKKNNGKWNHGSQGRIEVRYF